MEKVVSKESLSCFDNLYHGVISRLFNRMEDSRAENASYSMSDALKSGFAIYSLKCASLFSFRKRSQAEDSNLATVYRIGRIPTDNALRNILDKAKPVQISSHARSPVKWPLDVLLINQAHVQQVLFTGWLGLVDLPQLSRQL